MNLWYIVKSFKMLIKKLSSKKIASIVNKICLKFELPAPPSLLPSLLPGLVHAKKPCPTLTNIGTASALPTQVGWTKSGAGAALKISPPPSAF